MDVMNEGAGGGGQPAVLRYELPTHLGVEDKAIYGLSLRQIMLLALGITGAYACWSQWSALPGGVRLAGVLVCLLGAVLLALLRPGGRTLEDWGFVMLQYLAQPRRCVWRRRDPAPALWSSPDEPWVPLDIQCRWQPQAPAAGVEAEPVPAVNTRMADAGMGLSLEGGAPC